MGYLETALKYGLPIFAVGGGLAVAYSLLSKQVSVDAAKQQWEIYFNAYINKFESFNSDGTLTQEETDELAREEVLLNNAEKALADAVGGADPIAKAIQTLTIVGSGLLVLKYGVLPIINDYMRYRNEQMASGNIKTQYATIYESAQIVDALSVAHTDSILATQKLTAIQTNFNTVIIPQLQTQVNWLQTHMSQFIGIQLLYAQYMVTNLMIDASVISATMFPFAMGLIPMI